MACLKMRNVDSENRTFKDECTDQYMLVLPAASSKPLCLICCEIVVLIKSGNVKRHCETKHGSFEKTYPQKSAVRASKIIELKAQYDRSTCVLTHAFTGQQHANECSLKIAWILAQHKKAFSDGTVVKECFDAAAETLFDSKQKDDG